MSIDVKLALEQDTAHPWDQDWGLLKEAVTLERNLWLSVVDPDLELRGAVLFCLPCNLFFLLYYLLVTQSKGDMGGPEGSGEVKWSEVKWSLYLSRVAQNSI